MHQYPGDYRRKEGFDYMMKYFTDRLWDQINDPDDEIREAALVKWEERKQAYQAQLGEILSTLNKRNSVFWSQYIYDLHDGTLVTLNIGDGVGIDVTRKPPRVWRSMARMDVIDWNRPWLYTLKYRGLLSIDTRFKGDAAWEETMFENWGYSELTPEADGFFRHTILFSTGSQISLVFNQFSYTRQRLKYGY